jgi:hypothetical protein
MLLATAAVATRLTTPSANRLQPRRIAQVAPKVTVGQAHLPIPCDCPAGRGLVSRLGDEAARGLTTLPK